MSPYALTTLITATGTTATKIMLALAEVAANQRIVTDEIHACINIGVIVAWAGFFAALTRDTLLAKLTKAWATLAADITTDEAVNRASTEAHLAARSTTPTPRRPHLVP